MPPTIKTRLLSSARVQTSAKTRRNNFATSDARYTQAALFLPPLFAIINQLSSLPRRKLLYPRLFSHGSARTTKTPMAGPLSPRCQPPLPFARNTINDGLTYLLSRVCREFPRKSSSVELCQGGCAASFVRLPRDTSGFVVTLC